MADVAGETASPSEVGRLVLRAPTRAGSAPRSATGAPRRRRSRERGPATRGSAATRGLLWRRSRPAPPWRAPGPGRRTARGTPARSWRGHERCDEAARPRRHGPRLPRQAVGAVGVRAREHQAPHACGMLRRGTGRGCRRSCSRRAPGGRYPPRRGTLRRSGPEQEPSSRRGVWPIGRDRGHRARRRDGHGRATAGPPRTSTRRPARGGAARRSDPRRPRACATRDRSTERVTECTLTAPALMGGTARRRPRCLRPRQGTAPCDRPATRLLSAARRPRTAGRRCARRATR